MAFINSFTQASVVSTANSSTATLTANATFTGTSESTLPYGGLEIFVQPIGSSSPPGTLFVDQSTDGTNWDVTDSFAVDDGTAAGTGSVSIVVQLPGEIFRVRY